MISDPLVIGLMMGALLITLILLRVPVSFALGFSALPVLFLSDRATPVMLLHRMMVQYGSFIMLSIPFFILAANLMNRTGITEKLIRLAQSMVGQFRGGLGHINVTVSMLFSGLSGSSNADAAGIGGVLIPAMEKEGYEKKFCVAVTACSAVMGVIIPPSIIMIIWGGVLNTSISGLFLAGIIPGILIGLSQMLLVYVISVRRNYPAAAHFSFREVGRSFIDALLPLMTPVIIIGGIVGGFVTPTEASFLAVIYAIFLGGFVYKKLTVRDFFVEVKEAAKLSAIVLFAVGTASIYAWVLAYLQIPSSLVELIGGYTSSPVLMMFLIVLVFLFFGMFMDAVPAIIILAPLLEPLASASGISPLQFAITGCIALSFGLITPPYGLCLLIASEIAGINAMRAVKEVSAFLAVMLVILVLVILVPEITLWIPNTFLGSTSP